jgi:hypothetical protein
VPTEHSFPWRPHVSYLDRLTRRCLLLEAKGESFRRQGRLQASAAGNWLGPKPPPLEQLSTPKKIPPNPIAALFGRRALRFSNGVLMEACQPNLFPTTIEPSDLLIEGLPEKESRGDRT